VKEFQAVSELPVTVTVTGEQPRLPMETSAALYRIVQEGLGNIFRHARASSVRLDLAFEDSRVRLAIADDGVGLPESDGDGRKGFGMGNLRRRVADLGGTIEIRSEAGEGTCIEVCVPVDLTPGPFPGREGETGEGSEAPERPANMKRREVGA
jgi:signal transduction histidine kinase